jgi:hypothetical protein
MIERLLLFFAVINTLIIMYMAACIKDWIFRLDASILKMMKRIDKDK